MFVQQPGIAVVLNGFVHRPFVPLARLREALGSIRFRAMLVSVAGLVSALVVVAAVAFNAAESERAGVVQRALAAARTAAQSVDREIAAAEALLAGLATSPALRRGDLAELYEQLAVAPKPADSWLVYGDSNRTDLFGTPHPSAANPSTPRKRA